MRARADAIAVRKLKHTDKYLVRNGLVADFVFAELLVSLGLGCLFYCFYTRLLYVPICVQVGSIAAARCHTLLTGPAQDFNRTYA